MQRFERYFRAWDYRVSHDQLLIRSAKDDRHPRNVDIVFAGVRWMRVKTSLRQLEIVSPTDADLAAAREALGDLTLDHGDHITVLTDGSYRSIVVAAGMKVIENDLDFMESSLERFKP